MAKITYEVDGEVILSDIGTNSYVQLKLRQIRRKVQRFLLTPEHEQPEFNCIAVFDDGFVLGLTKGQCHIGSDLQIHIDQDYLDLLNGEEEDEECDW